ncbi:DNA directed RNA polymerase subunit delta [Spiroplasma sp. TIUS-1]|uniref:DNA-directed RNA polymerase subunit delta n=1 Tax=Spiroplasma sp. TIUS-1 TaxID=216963 RepID=UPI001398AFAD|nr:DNA-directed RNA polymerase subunit delta [Spiroplasma sp. TIUS-1]QHX36216.1 DNA directed RNA polymerase subunit delta [Spiroplasma sp. TIUS-1]
MNHSIIEQVFNLLDKSKEETVSFEKIWTEISKDMKLSKSDKNDLLADLYSDLVLDNRFALTADGNWALRKNLKLDEIKKQYDYLDNFETTEFFDEAEMAEETMDFEVDANETELDVKTEDLEDEEDEY